MQFKRLELFLVIIHISHGGKLLSCAQERARQFLDSTSLCQESHWHETGVMIEVEWPAVQWMFCCIYLTGQVNGIQRVWNGFPCTIKLYRRSTGAMKLQNWCMKREEAKQESRSVCTLLSLSHCTPLCKSQLAKHGKG